VLIFLNAAPRFSWTSSPRSVAAASYSGARMTALRVRPARRSFVSPNDLGGSAPSRSDEVNLSSGSGPQTGQLLQAPGLGDSAPAPGPLKGL